MHSLKGAFLFGENNILLLFSVFTWCHTDGFREISVEASKRTKAAVECALQNGMVCIVQ